MEIQDLTSAIFVGQDFNLNLPESFTGADLQALLDRLLPLLHTPGANVADGAFQAGEKSLVLRAAEGDALHQYLIKRRLHAGGDALQNYLVRLCLDPEYHRWQSQYVVLSGGFRTGPVDFSRSYLARYAVGEGLERKIHKEPLPDVRAALTTRDPRFQTPGKLILLAQPGAGKTTVLRRLASDLALHCLQDANGHLPFYASLAQQGENEPAQAFLERVWREQLGVADAGDLQALRLERRLCLLLDGVNEMRTGRLEARLAEWRAFVRDLPSGNQVVFTCRTDDYGTVYLGVQQVEIDPLSPEQIRQVARRALGEDKAEQFWAQLEGPHAGLLWMAETPFYLQLLIEEFGEHGTLPPHRAHLLVHVVMRLFQREQDRQPPEVWLPSEAQRDALAELAFAMQAQGEGTVAGRGLWEAAIPTAVKTGWQTVATPAERVVALACQSGLLRRVDDEAVGSEGGDTADAADTARAVDTTSGQEAENNGERIRFRHQLFQEYFAAEALCLRFVRRGRRCGLPDLDEPWRVGYMEGEVEEIPRGEWDPLPAAPVTRWEQTTILAAGLQPALAECVRRVNPALAARCLLELPGGQNHAAAGRVRQDLLGRLSDANVHLRSRIEAGLLLGRLGDPRFPSEEIGGVKAIRPPMVEINTAGAVIGSVRGTPDFESDEIPRHPVTLSPYAIGRYPVTRGEYACFVEAGGYGDERYWTAGGKYWRRGEPVPGDPDPVEWYMTTWRRRKQDPGEIERFLQQGRVSALDAKNWRMYLSWQETEFEQAVRRTFFSGGAPTQPRFWDDNSYSNLSQPVVGVTWYEAAAYATWLSAVTGEPYRLLSEAEWEWAASGGERVYPWGDDWDPAMLNSLEGKVLRTTPVGAYLLGGTPEGVMDLAGNVWEWTATIYAPDAYKIDADNPQDREDLDGTGYRVVRGGGWAAKREWVRCAVRCWVDPRDGYIGRGFRLARTLS